MRSLLGHSLRVGHTRKRRLMGAFLCVGDLEGSNSRVRAETRQRRDQRGEAEAHLSGRAIPSRLRGLWPNSLFLWVNGGSILVFRNTF